MLGEARRPSDFSPTAPLRRWFNAERSNERLEQWEERANLPLLVLAGLMLPLLMLPLLSELDPLVELAMEIGDGVIWFIFAVDLLVRLRFAENRREFLRRNWIDVLVVAVPVLRPLRVALFALRLWRLLDRRGLRGTVALALVVMVGASLAVWIVERHSGGEVQGLDSAFWWTLHTMATGDGVKGAETLAGRVLGVLVTLLGFALLGMVTATIAAWFVESGQDEEQMEILSHLERVEAELKELRLKLGESNPAADIDRTGREQAASSGVRGKQA